MRPIDRVFGYGFVTCSEACLGNRLTGGVTDCYTHVTGARGNPGVGPHELGMKGVPGLVEPGR